jgi:hypothetical protein
MGDISWSNQKVWECLPNVVMTHVLPPAGRACVEMNLPCTFVIKAGNDAVIRDQMGSMQH